MEESTVKKKLIYFFLLVILIAVLYLFRAEILEVIKQNQTIWVAYTYLIAQLQSHTLQGLFMVIFTSSLFFVFIPPEIVYTYYLTTDNSVVLLLLVTIVANTLGLLFNFILGYVIGKHILHFIFRERFDSIQDKVHRYGGFIVLIGNIIPFPIQLASLIIGSVRYSIKRFLIYCVIGQIIKYTALIFLSNYLIKLFSPFISSLNIL